MQIARSQSASNGMDQKIKNYLGISIIVALSVFSLSLRVQNVLEIFERTEILDPTLVTRFSP